MIGIIGMSRVGHSGYATSHNTRGTVLYVYHGSVVYDGEHTITDVPDMFEQKHSVHPVD